jgi:hypothetical protein
MNKKLEQGLIYTSITAANVAILYFFRTAIILEMLIYSAAISGLYYLNRENSLDADYFKTKTAKLKDKYDTEKQDILSSVANEIRAEKAKTVNETARANKNYDIALANKKKYEQAESEAAVLSVENGKLKSDLDFANRRINTLLRKQAPQAAQAPQKKVETKPEPLQDKADFKLLINN